MPLWNLGPNMPIVFEIEKGGAKVQLITLFLFRCDAFWRRLDMASKISQVEGKVSSTVMKII